MVRSFFESDEPDTSAALANNDQQDERREEHAGPQDRAAHRPGHHQHHHCRDDRHAELDKMDRLHCAAAGSKAESEYFTAVETKLYERDEQLSNLPGQYAAQRTAAQEALADAAKKLKVVWESLKCDLDDADRKTFPHAWRRVKERLDRCSGPTQLYPGPHDCDFPVQPREDTKTLKAQQTEYTARVEAAEHQFDELAKEPAALAQRVTDLNDEVDALAPTPGEESPAPRRRYATLLVAEYHATPEYIFAGIPSGNAYEEYLRRNLSCSIKGRQALTEIAGQLRVRECNAEKRRARCTALKARLAEEILAEVEDIEDEQHHHHEH